MLITDLLSLSFRQMQVVESKHPQSWKTNLDHHKVWTKQIVKFQTATCNPSKESSLFIDGCKIVEKFSYLDRAINRYCSLADKIVFGIKIDADAFNGGMGLKILIERRQTGPTHSQIAII